MCILQIDFVCTNSCTCYIIYVHFVVCQLGQKVSRTNRGQQRGLCHNTLKRSDFYLLCVHRLLYMVLCYILNDVARVQLWIGSTSPYCQGYLYLLHYGSVRIMYNNSCRNVETVELLRGGLSVETCITYTTNVFTNHQIVDFGDFSNVRPSGSIPSLLLRCGVCGLVRIKTVHWEDAGSLKLYKCCTLACNSQRK